MNSCASGGGQEHCKRRGNEHDFSGSICHRRGLFGVTGSSVAGGGGRNHRAGVTGTGDRVCPCCEVCWLMSHVALEQNWVGWLMCQGPVKVGLRLKGTASWSATPKLGASMEHLHLPPHSSSMVLVNATVCLPYHPASLPSGSFTPSSNATGLPPPEPLPHAGHCSTH